MKKQLFSKIGKCVLSVFVLVMMIAQTVSFTSQVKADDNVGLEINGYQISTTLEAFRTVYSVSDPSDKVAEVGLIYGLTDHITEADMVVGSTNKMVYSHAATDAGKSEVCYSKMENAQTYVMTMEFVKDVNFFQNLISVKPYAKLKDGTYVYGATSSKSVYQVADILYQNQLMGNASKHDYLFDKILSFVDSSYEKKDFQGSSTIVKPGTAEESTTPKATEPETSVKYEDSTAHAVDGSLAKPVGLTFAGNADLPYYFAWAATEGCDSYDVYVNGKYVTSTIGSSVNLDASVFTIGAGEYTIGVGAVYGDKVSEATTVPFTYTGGIVLPPESSSEAPTPEPDTPKPSTGDYTTDSSIAQPFGIEVGSPENGTISVVWGRGDIDLYNVYIDGTLVGKEVTCGYYTYNGYTSGTHTVAVATVVENRESERVAANVTVGGGSQPDTTATPVPTQPSTTPSTDFTLDTSIPVPFGMVLSSPSQGMVNVVWGQGEINCYNVYVDGERRRTGVKAQSLTMPVYFEGTHTVAIATVVGTRESQRVEMSVAVVGVGEKETEPETCPEDLKPQLRSDLSFRDDRILMQLNNKTNGKYSDSQVYWCLLGYNDAHQLCYLDKDGNMIPANLGMNNVKIGDRTVADVSYTLAEADHVYVPSISSARMYLSYEKPIYVTFNQAADGTIGFAGPDLNNATDPNVNTYFEFAEFTIDGKNYWGNTTRVDFFSFPMITRLVGHTQYETYDKTVGDIGTRDEIFASFRNTAPAAFQSCITDMRIICPCKSGFNEGMAHGNYFDAYINEFWTKYASQDLVFSSEAGSFTGRVVGDRMQFTRTGDSTIYYVDKPTTQDVLEGKGAFDRGNGVELAIEAQLCAAFNRGVATEPEKWYKPAEYYKNSTNNFYAGFFHSHSVVGLAYGFCYDDVNDQSTLLQYDNADALIIDLKW